MKTKTIIIIGATILIVLAMSLLNEKQAVALVGTSWKQTYDCCALNGMPCGGCLMTCPPGPEMSCTLHACQTPYGCMQ